MTSDSVSASLPAFRLQLVEVYLMEATVAREADERPEPRTPELEIGQGEPTLQDASRTLVITIDARVGIPYKAGWILRIGAKVAGHFTSTKAITQATAREFCLSGTALILLFPYLRANVGELGRMTRIDVPALPIIDVSVALQAVQAALLPTAKPVRAGRRAKVASKT